MDCRERTRSFSRNEMFWSCQRTLSYKDASSACTRVDMGSRVTGATEGRIEKTSVTSSPILTVSTSTCTSLPRESGTCYARRGERVGTATELNVWSAVGFFVSVVSNSVFLSPTHLTSAGSNLRGSTQLNEETHDGGGVALKSFSCSMRLRDGFSRSRKIERLQQSFANRESRGSHT